MDRLNSGSEAFAAVDLTAAAAKGNPAGSIVGTYTNITGRDIKVIAQISIPSGLDANAATFTVALLSTISATIHVGMPIFTGTKQTTSTSKIHIDLPERLLVINEQMDIYLHSSNGSDTSEAGNVYICEVNTDINVRAVGGNTPAIPPTNWSSMVINTAGRILSGFTRLF